MYVVSDLSGMKRVKGMDVIGRRPPRGGGERLTDRLECSGTVPVGRVPDVVSLADDLRSLPSVAPDPAFRRELRDRLLAEFQGPPSGE